MAWEVSTMNKGCQTSNCIIHIITLNATNWIAGFLDHQKISQIASDESLSLKLEVEEKLKCLCVCQSTWRKV